MKTTQDVMLEINRKLKAAILENPTRVDMRPTADDVVCAVAFVAFMLVMFFL